jgi:2-octaprenylphenol hydroxylase
MSREFDIVVVGAGVIGTVAAGLLAANRISAPSRIAVVAERLPADGDAGHGTSADWDLRVFALSRASERLLRLCGIWDALPADRRFGYERMCVWDATGSPEGAGSIAFDSAEIGEANLGSIVDGRTLQHRALQAARDAGIVLLEAGVGEVDVGDRGVRIGLSDGRELRAQLLLGADGPESKTREALKIGTAGHAYHQDALVFHVRTGKPHQSTAWQRFLPTGPLAFLPLPDGRSSIVWSALRAEAERLRALDASQLGAALTEASGEVLRPCEVTTPVASFPLRLQYALDDVRPRAALLGDAAHVVHPLAGQGMNLGLLDCAALVEVLRGAADPRSLGDLRLLRRYERWRRSENMLAAAAFDGFDRLFSNGNPLLAGLRAAGLGAAGGVPWLRRQFARRALGLSGDVPALLRARPPRT